MSSFQDINNASLYEPRIEFIKKQLESLLSVVDLEKDGQVVEVDGFRLKNLKDWLSPSPCDPSEVFDYAGTRCDCDCVFCYNKGNPHSVALGNLIRPPDEEFEDIKTRVNYFLPKAGSALFPSLGNIYEVMIHPNFLEALRLIRTKTSKVFRITTSGTTLTPEVISQLAELQPVYLYHSLNSASPSQRQRLMRDNSSHIAIESLPLLKEAGIPYAVLIVPWPMGSLDEMLHDLVNTVAYADAHHCHLVEINLPGYSRCFSKEKLFDLDEVWSKTVSCIRTVRQTTTCPIVVMPSMYEENLYEARKNLPRITGLVRNSPAAMAGLAQGDIVLEINGIPIASRPQARDLLSLLQRSENRESNVTVERGESVLKLSLNLEYYSYPYSREADRHLGVIFMGTGLRISYLEELRDLIDSHKAKHVLFLSSALVKPIFEQCLAESRLFGSVKIDVQIPRNKFFGGNVFMGDLLMVQDFIDFIEEYIDINNKVRPDLIVIPSSPFNLGHWGRDLTGRVYLDIERNVGIPVELLECGTIYD